MRLGVYMYRYILYLLLKLFGKGTGAGKSFVLRKDFVKRIIFKGPIILPES